TLIADIGNVVDGLVEDEVGNALLQRRLVYLVRDLGDDDGLTVFREVLDRSLGAHGETPASVFVGVENPRLAMNDPRRREVRTFYDFQNLRQRGRRIVNQGDGRIHDFGQVVRRNIGRHAHRDSTRTVDQQIGNARRQNHRLTGRFIEIGDK